MSHKQRVIDFIKYDRSLTGAKNIYNSLPNKSLSFLGSLNRLRGSEEDLKRVAYELCKAVGLEERQMLAFWGTKVQAKPEEEKEQPEMVVVDFPGTTLEKILSLNPATASWKEIQELAGALSDDSERDPDGRKKVDLLAFIQSERELAIVETSKEVPIEVKKTIKLREQFPFLREKDCPDVLKLLINEMITAYEKYKAGRSQLFASLTAEEEGLLSRDIVDNFIENKQAFAELEHYKNTGQILGAHPIFEAQKIKEELDALNAEGLNLKYNSLRKNISTNKRKSEETEDVEEKAKYDAAVEMYQWQAKYVKDLLKKK
jgi:hypothetical protein